MTWHKNDMLRLNLLSLSQYGNAWPENLSTVSPSQSDSVWCWTVSYTLDSARLSGRVFVEADTTKYGPLEEIKTLIQESLVKFTILLLLSCALEPSEILFATLSFIFHAFLLCVTNLPRKLTVVSIFSTPPPFLFFFSLFSSAVTPHLQHCSGNTSLQATPYAHLILACLHLCSVSFPTFTNRHSDRLIVSFLASILFFACLLGGLKWC